MITLKTGVGGGWWSEMSRERGGSSRVQKICFLLGVLATHVRFVKIHRVVYLLLIHFSLYVTPQ